VTEEQYNEAVGIKRLIVSVREVLRYSDGSKERLSIDIEDYDADVAKVFKAMPELGALLEVKRQELEARFKGL